MKRTLPSLLALALLACSAAEASPLRRSGPLYRASSAVVASVPLPNDASIFGTMDGDEDAFYIARVQDLACDGVMGDCSDGETVETWQNANAPGTRDITFSPAPTFEDGGSNGKSYIHCDGTNDEGVSTGWGYVTGEEPFVIGVGRWHTNGSPGNAIVLSDGDDGSEFAIGFQQRTTVWRWNGSFVNVPHAVSGAAPDTNWHVSALLTYSSTGFRGDLDGTLDADVGGTGGISGTLDTLLICVGANGTGEFGQVDLHEIVIVSGEDQTGYDNYLVNRVEPEYAIATD